MIEGLPGAQELERAYERIRALLKTLGIEPKTVLRNGYMHFDGEYLTVERILLDENGDARTKEGEDGKPVPQTENIRIKGYMTAQDQGHDA